jgi:hypothetical protein
LCGQAVVKTKRGAKTKGKDFVDFFNTPKTKGKKEVLF